MKAHWKFEVHVKRVERGNVIKVVIESVSLLNGILLSGNIVLYTGNSYVVYI